MIYKQTCFFIAFNKNTYLSDANATKLWICLKPIYAYVHFGTLKENKQESSLLTKMEDEVFVGKKGIQ